MSAEFLAPVQAIVAPVPPSVASLPSIAPNAPYDGPEGALGPRAAAVSGPGFGTLLADGVRSVDAQLRTSQVDLQRMAAGEPQNLHQVMVNLEEARIGFQLLLQVRNRLLESYQDVMRMQV